MAAWYAGKTAIITGGTSGIGLGIARHMAKHGARVMVAGLPSEDSTAVLRGMGSKQVASDPDVTSWRSQHDLFTSTAKAFGPRIDYVLANAGTSDIKEMRTQNSDAFSADPDPLNEIRDHPPNLRVLETNLTGVAYSVYLALAQFRHQDRDGGGWRGKVVLTGSSASLYPFPVDVLYNASKMGVLGLTRGLGPKVLEEGITVNCFGPLVVRTGLANPAFFDDLDKKGFLTPMKTITDCMDMFLRPESVLTGQIAENYGDRNILRVGNAYSQGITRSVMDLFYDVDKTDNALSVKGYDAM